MMVDEKPSRALRVASKIAACFMITVNFVVMVLCSVVFAFIMWMMTSPDSLSNAIKAGGRTLTALLDPESFSIHSAVAVSCVVIITFLVAFMGFYGVISYSKLMLLMYSSLVILWLFLEIALMYYFTSSLIEKGLREDDGQWTHYTRLAFQCCDFNTSQYADVAVPPWSCCGIDHYPDNCTVPDSFTKDCVPTIQQWVDRYKVLIFVSLTVLHIMLFACSLLWQSHKASRSHS